VRNGCLHIHFITSHVKNSSSKSASFRIKDAVGFVASANVAVFIFKSSSLSA
jgi:hypothetical protein